CTKFIATIAKTRFGFNDEPVQELIEWADIIDGAQFPDPKMAAEVREPALQLEMTIEATQDPALLPRLVPGLSQKAMGEIVDEPFVSARIPPLLERHHHSIELMKERTEYRDGTVFFDVSDQALEGYNKFIPYYLHPESAYSVGLSKSSFRTKVSVGSNPWTKADPAKMVNLAQVCERYGGGGHAPGGAGSFSPDHSRPAPPPPTPH